MPSPTTPQTLPLDSPLLMRSIANPHKRPLTAEDYTLFTGNPTTLSDKQFLHEEDEDNDEVAEMKFQNGSWAYEVRFEGCYDTVPKK